MNICLHQQEIGSALNPRGDIKKQGKLKPHKACKLITTSKDIESAETK